MSRPHGLVVVYLLAAAAAAADLPAVSATQVADGFRKPTHIASADDDRIFVVEQGGRVWILRDGVRLEKPFLDIHERVFQPPTDCCDEQGLLSIAFPPDFKTKKYFYVDYVDPGNRIHVSRFHLSDNPDEADPASEEQIWSLQHLNENHYGGQLAFHPLDGKLYVSVGDGGGGSDPLKAAMDPDQLFGKIFRLDVEKNDFAPEVFAMGFRNPWRFSFDRSTGDLYAGDVGEDTWEEFDFAPNGAEPIINFGWSLMEGNHCYREPACESPYFTPPIFEFNHKDGCSATGGFVYRGAAIQSLKGVYLGADFCLGTVYAIARDGVEWNTRVLLDDSHGFNISSFGEDATGEIYFADFVAGAVYRIEAAPPPEE